MQRSFREEEFILDCNAYCINSRMGKVSIQEMLKNVVNLAEKKYQFPYGKGKFNKGDNLLCVPKLYQFPYGKGKEPEEEEENENNDKVSIPVWER